jgi:hypothetical protein
MAPHMTPNRPKISNSVDVQRATIRLLRRITAHSGLTKDQIADEMIKLADRLMNDPRIRATDPHAALLHRVMYPR